MISKHQRGHNRACIALFAATGLLAFSRVEALPTVVGYQLVSSVRSGRTTTDFTYRARVQNLGADVIGTRLDVVSSDPATTVLKGELYAGPVARDSTILTSDVFIIRQDRTRPFNWSALRWSVRATEVQETPEPPTLVDFDLVEFRGRAGHEGLFALSGEPLAGDSVVGLALFSGRLSNARYELLSEGGDLLGGGPLQPYVETDSIPDDYLAQVVVPDLPFRVRMLGNDTSGHQISVTAGPLFMPASIQVGIENAHLVLPAGSRVTVPVRVSNLGIAGRFSVTVTPDEVGVVEGELTTQVDLAAGSQRDFLLNVTVPEYFEDDSHLTVDVSVESVSEPFGRNHAVIDILVEGASQ